MHTSSLCFCATLACPNIAELLEIEMCVWMMIWVHPLLPFFRCWFLSQENGTVCSRPAVPDEFRTLWIFRGNGDLLRTKKGVNTVVYLFGFLKYFWHSLHILKKCGWPHEIWDFWSLLYLAIVAYLYFIIELEDFLLECMWCREKVSLNKENSLRNWSLGGIIIHNLPVTFHMVVKGWLDTIFT